MVVAELVARKDSSVVQDFDMDSSARSDSRTDYSKVELLVRTSNSVRIDMG